MTRVERFDIVIAGAGCAGLSLAVHLAERGLGSRRVLVVDPRTSHDRDRTWCYWDVTPHPFEAAVTHRWTRWRVATPTGDVTVGSHRYAYCHLPSDAFYRHALDRLAREGGVELRLGSSVTSLEPDADGVTVRTADGDVRCGLAFDSRPPRLPAFPPAGEIRLLQHFKGVLIRSHRRAFDPTTVTLMDFAIPAPAATPPDGAAPGGGALTRSRSSRPRRHGITVDRQLVGTAPGVQRSPDAPTQPADAGAHFVYVLPYDEHTALVEDTWMSATTLEEADYDRTLDAYLRSTLGLDRWDILDEERGVLPMTTERLAPKVASRVVPIGLRGGAARPSTGYAFLAIQRASAALTPLALAGAPLRPPAPQPALLDRMDRVFLSVLARHPDRAASLFLGMFRDANPDRLIRFLSATATLGDLLAVMRANPALPFLREALRQAPGLVRS